MARLLPALALALLTPQLAAAHDGAHDEADPAALTIVAPVDGAQEVPTNTLVWLDETTAELAEGEGALHLLSVDGDDVPLARTSEIRASTGTLTVWRPERDLLPDSRYVLSTREGVNHKLAEFRTRSGPDDAAPVIPDVDLLTEIADHITTTVRFDGLLVVAAGEDDLDAGDRTGDVLGVGLPDEPIDLVAHQSVNSVRVGVYDLAGNFSGFTDPLKLEREKSPVSAACTVSDDPPSALLVILLALGLARPRRARPRA